MIGKGLCEFSGSCIYLPALFYGAFKNKSRSSIFTSGNFFSSSGYGYFSLKYIKMKKMFKIS